jgi:type II secretory pathway pseudopilin PulG
MNKISFSDPRRGQTLVEALIALTILTVGFIGIMTLLTKSFQLNRINADQTQATYLAAEGIEVAKNIIDHDVYLGIDEGGTGDSGWGNSFPQSGYYNLDYLSTSTQYAYMGDTYPPNVPLYFDPTTDLYGITPSGATVPTDFTRSIKVTQVSIPPASGFALDVQSTVAWKNGLTAGGITLEDQFYDWHP